MPNVLVSSRRYTPSGERVVKPVLDALEGGYDFTHWAGDGAIVPNIIALAKGRPQIRFEPKRGTVAIPSGPTVNPREVVTELKTTPIPMGVGIAIGFQTVMDEAEALRRAQYEAINQGETDKEVHALTSLLLETCAQTMARVQVAVATQTMTGKGLRKRIRINGFSRR